MWKVGDRVQIALSNPREWTSWAVERMGGASGVIEEASSGVDRWGRAQEVVFLIRFDAPIAAGYSYGRAVTHFHFAARDLAVVS